MAYGDDLGTEKSGAPDDLFEKLKGWYKHDVVKANTWRKEAIEDFKFRDGDQWTHKEKAYLEDQGRPVVCFNRTGVLVDAVVGSEIGNRREVRYIPREMADAKPNELLTSAAEWFRDQCDAEDEESEAFKDTVTAGMGWTETRLDYTDNPAGDPKIEHFDAMEAVWDCNAVKANLVDSKRRWRVRKMSLASAQELLPGVDPDIINAAWAENTEEDTEPHANNPGRRYAGDDQDGENKSPSRLITVAACQYEEEVPYYQAIILTPEGVPEQTELDEEKHRIAEKSGRLLKAVKLKKKRIVQCFLGATTITRKPEPTQTGTFTWNCITGLKDHDRGIFYGIVRRAKDPQRWANKWLSQMMHILNSQAKGGIMAEEGVFEDQRKAEETWSQPNAITYLTEGALAGPGGPKLLPKPVGQFPAGFDRLLQYASDMIVQATGINMEMLGMREVNQPGVLEYQRKQQGIAILATFFDSLRRYRKIQGRAMLNLIQNYLADGRKVRIIGEEQAQYVPLMKEQVANVEYDIIVDDAPSSPNEKEKTFQIIQSMLPMLKDSIGPEQVMIIAEYSPLPSSFIEKIKGSIEDGKNAPPDPMQEMAMQMEQMKLQLEEAKLMNESENIKLQLVVEANKASEIQIKAGLEKEKLDVERQQIRSNEMVAFNESNAKAQEESAKVQAEGGPQMSELMQGLIAAIQMMNAPKRVVRDPQTGRALGVETVVN